MQTRRPTATSISAASSHFPLRICLLLRHLTLTDGVLCAMHAHVHTRGLIMSILQTITRAGLGSEQDRVPFLRSAGIHEDGRSKNCGCVPDVPYSVSRSSGPGSVSSSASHHRDGTEILVCSACLESVYHHERDGSALEPHLRRRDQVPSCAPRQRMSYSRRRCLGVRGGGDR